MRVKTATELDHFIRYFNDFPNLNVNKKEYKEGSWVVYLNDGANYSISDEHWGVVQNSVPRLGSKKEVIQ